ncbi:MAG: hypothetical protein ISQ52_05515 [Synechococcus sp. BS307-5m-G38]|nr:hypothetical protein [Synechococcus sp. BS307-5m-G38]
MARYALLRHTGAPDDPSGCHFDLLVEEGDHCRTWRLADVPTPNGISQPAMPLAPHRRVWLEPRSAAVSGNRGWAERVMAGTIEGELPPDPDGPVVLDLLDGELRGILRIIDGHCSITRA